MEPDRQRGCRDPVQSVTGPTIPGGLTSGTARTTSLGIHASVLPMASPGIPVCATVPMTTRSISTKHLPRPTEQSFLTTP